MLEVMVKFEKKGKAYWGKYLMQKYKCKKFLMHRNAYRCSGNRVDIALDILFFFFNENKFHISKKMKKIWSLRLLDLFLTHYSHVISIISKNIATVFAFIAINDLADINTENFRLLNSTPTKKYLSAQRKSST